METKQFVGIIVNVILTRTQQTCSQRSSMSAGSKHRAIGMEKTAVEWRLENCDKVNKYLNTSPLDWLNLESLEDLYVDYQYMLVNVICRLTHMLFKILYAI